MGGTGHFLETGGKSRNERKHLFKKWKWLQKANKASTFPIDLVDDKCGLRRSKYGVELVIYLTLALTLKVISL